MIFSPRCPYCSLQSVPILFGGCSEADRDGCAQDGFDDCGVQLVRTRTRTRTAPVTGHTSSVAAECTSSAGPSGDWVDVSLPLQVFDIGLVDLDLDFDVSLAFHGLFLISWTTSEHSGCDIFSCAWIYLTLSEVLYFSFEPRFYLGLIIIIIIIIIILISLLEFG